MVTMCFRKIGLAVWKEQMKCYSLLYHYFPQPASWYITLTVLGYTQRYMKMTLSVQNMYLFIRIYLHRVYRTYINIISLKSAPLLSVFVQILCLAYATISNYYLDFQWNSIQTDTCVQTDALESARSQYSKGIESHALFAVENGWRRVNWNLSPTRFVAGL